MKLGIVGVGTVGLATLETFIDHGHDVRSHDIKFNGATTLNTVTDCEIIFLCVPTPTVNNLCDTSAIEDVIQGLSDLHYSGIVAIKSTVIPGTTVRLQQQYPNLTICCVPEFLRGDHAYEDFAEKYDMLIVGTDDNAVYERIKKAHMLIPHEPVCVSPTEAEFCKYFSNVYNALRVTFANDMFEVCQAMGVNYDNVYQAVSGRPTIQPDYLKCFENQRGYGGHCLPKDVEAFRSLVKQLNLDTLTLFNSIDQDNQMHVTKNIDNTSSN
jgi:UDPglucose 6-dehydrogenase